MHWNCPDPITGLSAAQIIFGHPVKDHLPGQVTKYQPREDWRLTVDRREQAFAKRHAKTADRLSVGAELLITTPPAPATIPMCTRSSKQPPAVTVDNPVQLSEAVPISTAGKAVRPTVPPAPLNTPTHVRLQLPSCPAPTAATPVSPPPIQIPTQPSPVLPPYTPVPRPILPHYTPVPRPPGVRHDYKQMVRAQKQAKKTVQDMRNTTH